MIPCGMYRICERFNSLMVLVFGFLVAFPLGFKARVGCLIYITEANAMYVP